MGSGMIEGWKKQKTKNHCVAEKEDCRALYGIEGQSACGEVNRPHKQQDKELNMENKSEYGEWSLKSGQKTILKT